jgi:drug efflux transport system ATP-binding protein
MKEELERIEGISSLVLTGDGVHVVIEDPARRIPQIKAQLVAAQVPFSEMRQVVPTIEDLFVDAVTSGSSGGRG